MRFLTEEIWQALPHGSTQDSIMIYTYALPQAEWDTQRNRNSVCNPRALFVNSSAALFSTIHRALVHAVWQRQRTDRTHKLEGLLSILEQLSRASVSIAPSDTWPAEKVLQLVTEGLRSENQGRRRCGPAQSARSTREAGDGCK